MVHRFAREELYALVWSRPLSKLATELGVSDVAIAKACGRADIPTPGLGYWTKVQHRKKVKQSPLPPPMPKTPTIVQFGPSLSKSYTQDLAAEVQEEIARESSDQWRITVPKRAPNPHRVVKTWVKEDRNRRERNLPPHAYPPQSRHNATIERRRLRILSALFGALERRGHQVTASDQNPYDVALIVNGERIEFSLSRRQKQFKKDLTPEEQRNPLNAALGIKSRTTVSSTDVLVFKIHSWIGMGMRTQWRDTARKPLEEQLNDIVASLLLAAAIIHKRRIEREEEQRRLLADRMERDRREDARRKEAQRAQKLLQKVSRWLEAANLRAYVNAVHEAAQTGRFKIDFERLETWASWALAQADQMDPIIFGDPLTESDIGTVQGAAQV